MQRPSALGLLICDQVIIDRDTGKRTYVGEIDEWVCEAVPFASPPFVVSAALTDGQGTVPLRLVISDINTDEEVRSASTEVVLPTPLATGRVRFRFRRAIFPRYGQYLFELTSRGEAICHRRLNIVPPAEE